MTNAMLYMAYAMCQMALWFTCASLWNGSFIMKQWTETSRLFIRGCVIGSLVTAIILNLLDT